MFKLKFILLKKFILSYILYFELRYVAAKILKMMIINIKQQDKIKRYLNKNLIMLFLSNKQYIIIYIFLK